jgi:predicted ABC-type ATPase
VSEPQVIIIAGPNGAGKTTLAPSLLRDKWRVLEYVNADPIAQGLSVEPTTVAIEVGRIMLRRIDSLAEQRRTFAFESTLAARTYVKRIESWIRAGYKFQLMFIWLRDADLAVERVHSRSRVGGHHIPDDVVRRRYAKGLKKLLDTL